MNASEDQDYKQECNLGQETINSTRNILLKQMQPLT